jgi:hypothetical protein
LALSYLPTKFPFQYFYRDKVSQIEFEMDQCGSIMLKTPS